MLSIFKPKLFATASVLTIVAGAAVAQDAPVFRRGETPVAQAPIASTQASPIPVVEQGTINAEGVYVPPSRATVQTGPIPVVEAAPTAMPAITPPPMSPQPINIVPGQQITPATAATIVGQPAAPADAYAKITELEAEIRRLTGKVEQQDFTIKQLQEQVKTLETAKIENAKQAPADAETPSKDATTKQADTTETEAILTEGSAKERYEQAIRFIQAGKYATAETALQQFLVDHRDHVLAGNAQYWLGESYYVRQQYANAAEAFLKGFEQYKNSTKAPDSLLKLAMSLGGLGSYDEACATLGQLNSKYPEAGRSLTERAKQEAQKFNCAA